MKIKADFVTNSSSTSFIMTCKSKAGGTADFTTSANKLFERYIKKEGWRQNFQSPPKLTEDMVEQIAAGVFIIRDFTPFSCGEQDIPQYIEDIFNKDAEAGDGASNSGITLVNIESKDLNK